MLDPKDVKTIKDLRKAFEEMLLIKDEGIIHIFTATILSNRMSFDSVWLMIVAPSAGGKSAIIEVLNDLDFVTHISDLTTNTFASGMKKTGTETSLLLKLNNGIMSFKDFTSILSKHRDDRKAIMAQLREIYDGHYDKQTGNGEVINWKGKVGVIAGATEEVYYQQEEFGAMGNRFIMYDFEQPGRLEVGERVLENMYKKGKLKKYIKASFHNYINFIIKGFEEYEEELELNDSSKKEIISIASFGALMRSTVRKDFKTGEVIYVPDPEGPARILEQMTSIGAGLVAMRLIENKDKAPKNSEIMSRSLNEFEKKLIYKVAFTSIPRTRRSVLKLLARYRGGVTTGGVGTALKLPTNSVRKFLYEVNALGACVRVKKGGSKGDLWILKDESYREIICRQENIIVEDDTLIGDEDRDEEYKKNREWAEKQDPNLPSAPQFDNRDEDEQAKQQTFDEVI